MTVIELSIIPILSKIRLPIFSSSTVMLAVFVLSPVHTSNNVEATDNFVACCFDIVAGVDRALDCISSTALILIFFLQFVSFPLL